jgi:CRP-like cAMP-binding protein
VLPNSQTELLSTAKLQLNPKLRHALRDEKFVIMRSPGGVRRLVVTKAQATILTEGFKEAKTVPEVLARLVGESRCPPLLVFYELVLQAYTAGVLTTGFEPTEYTMAVPWRMGWSTRSSLVAGTLITCASTIGLFSSLPRWQGPSGLLEFVGGWLAACLLISVGELLAACTISGSGADVRFAGFCWRSPFPHFRTDTDEAVMGGRSCEMAVAALRFAPVVTGAVLAAWRVPGFFAPAMLATLYLLGPWKQSAATQWLSGRFGGPRVSVTTSLLFEPVRDDQWIQWSATWRELRSKFGFIRLAWIVAWIGLLALAFVRCVPGATGAMPAWFGATGRGRPLVGVAFYTLVTAVFVGIYSIAWSAFKHWRMRRQLRKPIRGADARDEGRGDLKGNAKEVLSQVPLFSSLEEGDMEALSGLMEPVPFKAAQWVFNEDDPGDAFYLIQEGELEVLKRLPDSRRTSTIGWMGPGDCFGEIALLENTPRTASIRARRKSVLLKLGREDFDLFVLGRVGAAKTRELLQHARYLGRLAFMAGWPVNDLVEFAKRCNTVPFKAGAFVLRRGEANHFFYLIFDGWFEARDGERVLRRMGPGDYFGEISLLENWQATADVLAIEEGRCLTMGRTDFLALFTRGFRIALRMEAIAGQRLGADVFISR